MDDYNPRILPSIKEEAELVELRKVTIVEPKVTKPEPSKSEQAPLQEVALDEQAVVEPQDTHKSRQREHHHKKENFFTKIKHIFEHGDK